MRSYICSTVLRLRLGGHFTVGILLLTQYPSSLSLPLPSVHDEPNLGAVFTGAVNACYGTAFTVYRCRTLHFLRGLLIHCASLCT